MQNYGMFSQLPYAWSYKCHPRSLKVPCGGKNFSLRWNIFWLKMVSVLIFYYLLTQLTQGARHFTHFTIWNFLTLMMTSSIFGWRHEFFFFLEVCFMIENIYTNFHVHSTCRSKIIERGRFCPPRGYRSQKRSGLIGLNKRFPQTF